MRIRDEKLYTLIKVASFLVQDLLLLLLVR